MGNDINSLSGIEFENICKNLIENMGSSVETTKASGDGGIDLHIIMNLFYLVNILFNVSDILVVLENQLSEIYTV